VETLNSEQPVETLNSSMLDPRFFWF
jgi:hypothetical protein